MKIRTKLAGRLLIVALVFASVTVAAGGFYVFRKLKIQATLEKNRVDGIAAANAGDNQTAVDLLTKYLQRYPDKDLTASITYARVRPLIPLEHDEHLRSTVYVLRQLLKTHPDLIAQRRQLLDLYVQMHFWVEAQLTADALLPSGQTPTRADAPVFAARTKAGIALKSFDKAVEAAHQWARLDPQNIEAQLTLLELARQTGQFAEKNASPDRAPRNLIDLGERLIAQFEADNSGSSAVVPSPGTQPGSVDPSQITARAAMLRGHALFLSGQIVGARAQLKIATAYRMPDRSLKELFITELDRVGLIDESIAKLRQLESETHDPVVLGRLARRLWESGDSRGTVDLLASTSPTDPKAESELVAIKALAELQLHDNPAAKMIRGGLAARPVSDPLTVAWIALLDANLSPQSVDRPKLAALCEAALQSRKSAYLACTLGQIEAAAGDREAALSHWKSSAQWSETWAMPLLLSAELLSQTGQYRAASDAAQEAVNRAPHSTQAAMLFVQIWDTAFQNGAVSEPGPILEFIDKQLAPNVKDDGRLLCIRTDLLAAQGRSTEANAGVRAALDSRALSEQSLVQLISISRKRKLDVEHDCQTQLDKVYGNAPDMALARAMEAISAGNAAQGIEALSDARKKAADPQSTQWKIAWATGLDRANDPQAKAELVKLADEQPKNLALQLLMIDAQSTRGDRALLEKEVGRIHDLAGNGTAWRLANSRVILQFAKTEAEILPAVGLLEQVTRESPDALAAHVLLANAFERLHRNSDAAEQYKAAVGISPSAAQLGVQLANQLQLVGNLQAARDELNRVGALPAIDPAIRIAAAEVALRIGDTSLALSLAGKAAELMRDNSRGALFMAHLYWVSGKTTEANAAYEKLLANSSADLTTIETAAEFYASQGRIDKAREVLGRLDADKAHAGEAELKKAEFALKLLGPASAIEYYERAVTAEPSQAGAWLGLVAAQVSTGRVADAGGTVRRAAAALPTNDSIGALARHVNWLNDFPSAGSLRDVFDIFIHDPTNTAATASLELLLSDQKADKPVAQVMTDIDKLISQYPRFLPLYMCGINIQLTAGNFADATDRAAHTAQAFPAVAEPQAALVGILRDQRMWDGVLREAQTWRARSMANPLAPDMQIAEAYLQLGQPKEAIKQLDPYLQNAAKAPEAHRAVLPLYAAAQHKAGDQGFTATMEPLLNEGPRGRATWMTFAVNELDAAQATAWLNRAGDTIAPNAVDERILLAGMWGDVYRRHNDRAASAKAREILKAITGLPEPSAAALLSLGMLDESDNDLKSAEADYRMAVERAPDNTQQKVVAQNNLAMVLARNGGDLAEAANLAAAAIKAQPDAAALHDTLAFVEQERKRYPDAAASAQTAVRLAPRNLQFRIRLVQVLLDGGKVPAAQAALTDLDALHFNIDAEPDDVRQNLDKLRTAVNAAAQKAAVGNNR